MNTIQTNLTNPVIRLATNTDTQYEGVRERLREEGFDFAVTPENLKYVSDRFNGVGPRPLVKVFGVSEKNILKSWRHKARHGCVKCFDANYFDTESPERSYILGLLITDGNLYHDSIGFLTTDIELSRIVKTNLLSQHKITESLLPSGKISYRFTAKSEHMTETLMNRYGFTERKSLTIKLPEVGYFWHFLRGVIDGDGCVLHDKRAKYSKGLSVAIASGSLDFVEGLKKKIGGTIHKGTGAWQLSLCKSIATQIFEDVYKNSEGIRLERKYQKWLDGMVPMYFGTGQYDHSKGVL